MLTWQTYCSFRNTTNPKEKKRKVQPTKLSNQSSLTWPSQILTLNHRYSHWTMNPTTAHVVRSSLLIVQHRTRMSHILTRSQTSITPQLSHFFPAQQWRCNIAQPLISSHPISSSKLIHPAEIPDRVGSGIWCHYTGFPLVRLRRLPWFRGSRTSVGQRSRLRGHGRPQKRESTVLWHCG
jgi:hypothetical protein